MYQREFDTILKTRLPKAVLLYGRNRYALERYATYYMKRLDAKESALTLYFDEYAYDAAKNFLMQQSLFGGSNLLIIKHDKKIPKKELESLISLTQKNSEAYLLYLFYGEDKEAKSLQSAFLEKNGGVWVRFFEPNEREILALLQQRAQTLGLDIDRFALSHLLLTLRHNLDLAMNELEKLSVLNRKISSKDIDMLVYSTAPLATEKFLVELFEKKPIAQTLGHLLEQGEDESALLRATQYFIQQIFLFQAYIKLYGHVDSAAILGYKLPKHIENQKAALATKLSSSALLKALEHLLKSELKLKEAAGVQKETLLYATLISLQRILQ